MDNEDEVSEIARPLVIEEISALIRYASEKGIDRKLDDKETELTPASERKGSHNITLLTALNAALLAYKDGEKNHELEKTNDMIWLYSKLSKMTGPVNGRTLLDTARANEILRRIITVTAVLLLLAVMEVVLSSWWAEAVTPEEGLGWWLGFIQRDVLAPISPFLWGGLGACVYLLKRLYDIAEERCFDRQRLRGWSLRVLLGAILGFVVVQLFDLSVMGGGEAPLEANAVAFLIGLGVKVVYGAFEKLVQTTAEKLNLEAVRRAQTPAVVIHTYLNQKLAQAMDTEDGPRTKLYASVIEDLGGTPSGR